MTFGAAADTFSDELRRQRERRRISQLELATRALTTQRHISFLESSRSLPGRTMVIRLGDALALPLRDRNRLLLAAGFASQYGESGLDASSLQPVRDALTTILRGHLPIPAVLACRSGTAVAANRAFRALADGAADHLLEPPVNILRLALHPSGLAPRILNLPEWGRHVVQGLERRADEHDDASLSNLAAELHGYLPDSGDDHPSALVVPLHLATTHGELQLMTTRMTFATAPDITVADLELEAFLPADAPTAAALREADHQARNRPSIWVLTPDWPS